MMEGVLKMQKQFRGSSFLKISDEEIKVDYYLIEETKFFYEDEKPRTTYGIEIVENDNESEIIKDITLDEEKAVDMIDIMKNNDVLPIHLHDVIEDLL